MNIVRLSKTLAIRQAEFNFLEVRSTVKEQLNGFIKEAFDLVVNYSDDKEYVVFSCPVKEYCEFMYYAYLYLFSCNSDIGVLEIDFNDSTWLRDVHKKYWVERKLILNTEDRKLLNKLNEKYKNKIKKYITVEKYSEEKNDEE